jgi:hypothetical protein
MSTATISRERYRVQPGEHKEGDLTTAIEHYTSQVPSGAYLTLAVGSIAASALLQLAGHKQTSTFVGQWVPTILLLGLYNKLVKLEGTD